MGPQWPIASFKKVNGLTYNWWKIRIENRYTERE